MWFIILLFPITLSRPSTVLDLDCFRIDYSDSLLDFHSTKPPYVVEMVMQNRRPTEARSNLIGIAIIVFAMSLANSFLELYLKNFIFRIFCMKTKDVYHNVPVI